MATAMDPCFVFHWLQDLPVRLVIDAYREAVVVIAYFTSRVQ